MTCYCPLLRSRRRIWGFGRFLRGWEYFRFAGGVRVHIFPKNSVRIFFAHPIKNSGFSVSPLYFLKLFSQKFFMRAPAFCEGEQPEYYLAYDLSDLPHPPDKDRYPEGYQYYADNHSERPLVLCPHAVSPFRGYAIRNKKGDQDKWKDIDKICTMQAMATRTLRSSPCP